jgi:excisionase family DNA binding protein
VGIAGSAGAAGARSRRQAHHEDEDRSVRAVHAAQPERLAYTVEEAAAVVGVGRDLLYDEIRTGRLKSKKAGARRVIARHHLLEWLDGDVVESDLRAS